MFEEVANADRADFRCDSIFLGRIAKQRGAGWVPANDRSQVVHIDESVSDLIENSVREFGRFFHGYISLDWSSVIVDRVYGRTTMLKLTSTEASAHLCARHRDQPR